MMKLAVTGATGRMGQSLIRAIAAEPNATLVSALEWEGSRSLGQDSGELAGTGKNDIEIIADAKTALADCDAVIDFTTPQSSVALAGLCAETGTAHVIGTTGCTPEEDAQIAAAGAKTTIVKSGNMSLGVNLLAILVEQAANALKASDFDIDVLEMHHKHKVDAPSGTALLLGEAAAQGRGIDLSKNSVRVRDGQTGPREEGSIGFATLRGGGVVGDHSVILAGEGEMIEISHRALDRSVFAIGGVKAALWTDGKQPGFYTMRDVLGI